MTSLEVMIRLVPVVNHSF